MSYYNFFKNFFISKWFFMFLSFLFNILVFSFNGNWNLVWYLNLIINLFIWIFSSYFVFIFFRDFFSQSRLFKVLKNSPISLLIGALGTGKTLLATHLLLNSDFEDKFSNYYINSDFVNVGSLDNLDFNKLNSPVPYGESTFMVFDEMQLYIPANDLKSPIIKSRYGCIPSFVLARQFDINLLFIGQRLNHHWIEYRELATGLFIPMHLSKPLILGGIFKYLVWLNPCFKMKIVFFNDKDTYDIWKQESIKRNANGKKTKLKKSVEFGNYKFTIYINLLTAMNYDSKYLSFVRSIKNDCISLDNKSYFKWNNIDLNSLDTLINLGMDNLYRNLSSYIVALNESKKN